MGFRVDNGCLAGSGAEGRLPLPPGNLLPQHWAAVDSACPELQRSWAGRVQGPGRRVQGSGFRV